MRIRIVTFCATIITAVSLFAQSPEKMSYQAVIRDSDGSLVTNTQVGMRISILQGSVTGTEVYSETQTPTSNANGLVSIEIGTGTTSDDFSTVDWSNGPYFLKTETDPSGGSDYTITGVSELLSVPYALHAKTAESFTGTLAETDPIYSGSEAANITGTDITNLDNLSGTNTGDQDISGIAENRQAIQDTASQIRADMPVVSGFLTSESDPTFTASQAANITANDITDISNLSGINTGDQDISNLATKTALGDSTALVRSEIPDVSGFLSSETDPVYAVSVASGITAADTVNWNNKLDGYTETDPTFSSSEAANITATDITNLGNLSGFNTGDQKLTLSNDTLFFSNDSDTTSLDLSDLTIEKEWLVLTFPDYDINTTTTVNLWSNAGNMTVSANTITLHANICYELDANLVFGSTGTVAYQWYDLTNETYLGNTGLYYGGGPEYGNAGTHFIIKPSTDIQVDLRVRTINILSRLWGTYSYGIIKEL